MTHRRQKLELTWIGKEKRPRLEPRILLEDPARSYHAPHRVSEHDLFDNRLIFGDNLLALKQSQQWQNCRITATTICYTFPDEQNCLYAVERIELVTFKRNDLS